MLLDCRRASARKASSDGVPPRLGWYAAIVRSGSGKETVHGDAAHVGRSQNSRQGHGAAPRRGNGSSLERSSLRTRISVGALAHRRPCRRTAGEERVNAIGEAIDIATSTRKPLTPSSTKPPDPVVIRAGVEIFDQDVLMVRREAIGSSACQEKASTRKQ